MPRSQFLFEGFFFSPFFLRKNEEAINTSTRFIVQMNKQKGGNRPPATKEAKTPQRSEKLREHESKEKKAAN